MRPPPTAPAHRPLWLILLASLTLCYGGLLLVEGLGTLGDPQASAHLKPARALPPAGEAAMSKLATAKAEVIARHQTAIRAEATASVALALLLLYAAAATLSRDRKGRAVTLAAAWAGIAYQLGSLPMAIAVARDYAQAGAPLLAQLMAVEPGTGVGAMTPDTLASVVRVAVVGMPVLVALGGLLGSALLIRYFGGHRGRVLYGLEPARGKR